MNTSNRYGVESMARQRQAEIEEQLRQAAEIHNALPARQNHQTKVRWGAIAATAVSLVRAIASLVIAHAR